MEVGAVKQAFNNEIILLKKNLNQAKIQTIHKLTRKAKTLTEKKAPDTLKDKLKRKAESAVREVLIIKKIKARDIARFIVTHTGKLNDYLNKPEVDSNKACARLLLHKSLQEKYKHIRGKFSNISIKDLFMSRQERLKLKKEERDKKKNKKKKKDLNTVNVEGEWNVVDSKENSVNKISGDEGDIQLSPHEPESDSGNDNDDSSDNSDDDNDEETNNDRVSDQSNDEFQEDNKNGDIDEVDSDNDSNESASTDYVNQKKVNKATSNDINTELPILPNKFEIKTTNKVKVDKKVKENKNKNLNEKLQKRKFNKETEEGPAKMTKIVDPFFITSTGENYMSLVEPRQPDEVKESHKQGNRKYRRAVMFGHIPKMKPKRNDFQSNNNFNKQNNFNKNNSNAKDKRFSDKSNNFNKKERNDVKIEAVPEKLHPSWEAKKKQSGILPFEGKKIVFD